MQQSLLKKLQDKNRILVMPRLCIFEADENVKLRQEIESTIKNMNEEELAKLQEFLKSGTARA